jgi:spermidine synthase
VVAVLCGLFFLSGAAALLFETLWFRQAGLTFGNSVWASSIVLASFMAGLALGNGLAARFGGRIRRPVRVYAGLELIVAGTGLALVLVLPSLTTLLIPVLGPFLDRPWLLNPLRLGCGFLLLLVPATAMGATLPLLVKALVASDPHFGSVLGRLYGWNTLGAVVGALSGEMVLIRWLGVRGTAAAAAGCEVAVAFAALLLARRLPEAVGPQGAALPRAARRAWRPLAAAFLAGGILLALEVVWFRFLHLFVHSGSLAFAVMLAVVLAGIGLGGVAGGALLRRWPSVFRHASSLACASGILVVVLYATFGWVLPADPTRYARLPLEVLGLAAPLVLPVSLLSGLLFPLVGAAVNDVLGAEARAVGLLTLANTLGAGLGALAAGFVLLPRLGMEGSFFLLAAIYGAVALLLARPGPPRPLAVRLAPGAALLAALLLFPFGLLVRRYLGHPARRYEPGAKIAALREGRSETVLLLRNDLLGEPLSYRLLTDGFGMSGTRVAGRRYMKLFVYLPVALHPDPKRALLISFGLGNTAKALVDTKGLERIDVVDISREILEVSRLVFSDPAQQPLRDPRVHVHVEDGRYFLETTTQRYDLITGEPPPPKNAGIVNLYTREYFQLIHDRLAEGGITTYWLPVHNLLESDARSIIRAFCDVFEDCSLWTGYSFDWMLVGSRNAVYSRSEADFARQWRDPAVAPELSALGLEVPEQLGALFLADARSLRAATRDALPLVDDFPQRLSNRPPDGVAPSYRRWMDVRGARSRFENSDFVRAAWPAGLRERTLAYFRYQAAVNQIGTGGASWMVGAAEHLREIHELLTHTHLRTLPLWELGSDDDLLRVAGQVAERDGGNPVALHQLGLAALAERAYARASDYFARAQAARPRNPELVYYRTYALCMAGRLEAAAAVAGDARSWLPDTDADRRYWRWMRRTFGLPSPEPPRAAGPG